MMERITREDFERFTANMQEPSFVREHRFHSFEQFQDSKLPDFRYGLNISVQPCGFQFSDVAIPRSSKRNELRINAQQQQVGIVQGKDWGIIREKEAVLVLQEFYNSSWNTEEDANKLSFFHGAFSNEVALIIIPEGCELKKPILVNLKIKEGPFMPTILVMAGENSRGTILMSKEGGEIENTYLSEEVKIVAKSGSSITFVSIQNLNGSVVQVQRRKAKALRDAHVRWVDVCIGAKFTKADISTKLEGSGSSADTTLLFIANGNQRYDIYTESLHEGNSSTSNILTKGVVNGKAKALSRGLVQIGEHAAGSNGYEKQDALLLSSEAEADAIPNLKIKNHDVRCTHGSTVGQIDKEKVFYLMSRGLSEEEAKTKIVEGYFIPVIEMFQDKTVAKQMQKAILGALA